METFESASFPAALPGTSAFIEERPSAEQIFLYTLTLRDIQASSEHVGVAEGKRQQWQSLKPLIQRLYIQEDKPFTYVADILREEHGFKTTKRQFLRKMKEWGFRKNVSRSERLKILGNLSRNKDEPVPDPNDRRLKPGKLKNWQRRYRGEISTALLLLSQRSPGQEESQRNESFGFTETQIRQASDAQESPSTFSTHDPYKNLTEEPEAAPLEDTSTETYQDTWPFDWSTIDVVGSPGLSNLFKGLEIECATQILPLSLDTTEYDDSPCLSGWEIQSLSNNYIESVDRDSNQRSYPKAFLSVESSFTNQHPHYPWRDVNNVFCGYNPSPLNEVYCFPPRKIASCKVLSPKLTVWESLETERKELEMQFSKLKKQFRDDNPAIIAVMEDLAPTYYNLREFENAERIYRRLVDVYLQAAGPRNVKTLQASIDVVDCIVEQSQYFKAQSLIQNLSSEIFKLLPSDHPITMEARITDADIAHNLEKYEKAEMIRRQILQIRLSSAGPRHPSTIEDIRKLSIVISARNTEEGENLMRTALQLSFQESTVKDTDRCKTMLDLAVQLRSHGSGEESYGIAAEAIQRFSPSLGPKYSTIIDLQCELGWSMYRLGRLIESEKLFRALISLHSHGEVRISELILRNLWADLASVLHDMDHTEEAAVWDEKSFQSGLSRYGAHDTGVVARCYSLGSCYEELGRYDDALKLFYSFVDKIRESGQDPNGEIEELESKILRIESLREQSTSEMSDEKESGESDSDNEQPHEVENYTAEKEVVVEGREQGELEKEDWLAFIHEEFTTSSISADSPYTISDKNI